MPTETDSAGVRLAVEGRLARITLCRPAALNALDLPMIESMTRALHAWATDSAVAAVLLEGSGDRAFCAGGDLGVLYTSAHGDPEPARVLWRAEYRLDSLIARFPKPVIALMDGITMGGGIGIAAHAGVRVVTERAVLAMPEVAIGLAPDVGGSLLLARAPGEVGTHVALTAKRIGAADAVYCGLADHVVASSKLPSLVDALLADPTADAGRWAEPPGAGELAADRAWIDACYSAGTVPEILARLRDRPEAAAAKAVQAMTAGAPTALKVALAALRRAAGMSSVDECLRQDFRLCTRFLAHPDLAEGIRAAIVDKDRAPRWSPPELSAVSDEEVARFFAPLGDDLVLP